MTKLRLLDEVDELDGFDVSERGNELVDAMDRLSESLIKLILVG